MARRFIGILLAVMITGALLAGCGGKTEAEQTDITTTTSPETDLTTTTPPETETTTQEILRPDDHTGNMDPLTGIENLPDEAVGKKPVAVMINNIVDALPQYGIEQAEIMMEMHVEYDLTRMMAIYPDLYNCPEICSVRSCRYYYPIFAAGFDAIYIHWGIDHTYAEDMLMGMDIPHIEVNDRSEFGEYYTEKGYISRDQERLNEGYALEHTSVVHGEKFPEFFEDLNINIEADKEGTVFQFNEYGKDEIPAESPCTYVDVQYGPQSSQFEYDPAAGVYKKYHCYYEHIDSRTGNQLTYTNVIVLETSIGYMSDELHRYIDWRGGDGAIGYYISKGGMMKIRWEKEDEYARIRFYDESGRELKINTGKTFIAINYPGSTYFY